jgi:hypothetical protein
MKKIEFHKVDVGFYLLPTIYIETFPDNIEIYFMFGYWGLSFYYIPKKYR